MGQEIKIGLIQMKCTDKTQDNIDNAVNYIRQAAEKGANIICTQELFKSQYFCQVEDKSNFGLAEKLDKHNPSLQKLCQIARELRVVLLASYFEKRAVGLYHNTTQVIDADGRILGKYRKMHIPDDPFYYEKFYFTPGDLGYRVFQTAYADIGVLICWDQWFPEDARLSSLGGAQIIFIPTAIGNTTKRTDEVYSDDWQLVQRGHAVANACYIAAVNRVGFEAAPESTKGIHFWGRSFVADPYGRVLEEASKTENEIVLSQVDLAFIETVRRFSSFPFRDRRIDSYQDLTKLYSD